MEGTRHDHRRRRGHPHHRRDLFVEAAGVEFAYRRFGRPVELPLVMLQHFRGNLDSWDPALTDALAAEREVILVDYPRVGFLDRRAE
jgi:pimeloyl-ACP methyl ester carboxylesterase